MCEANYATAVVRSMGDEGVDAMSRSAVTTPRKEVLLSSAAAAAASPATSEDSSPAPRRGPMPVPRQLHPVESPHCIVDEGVYVRPGACFLFWLERKAESLRRGINGMISSTG